MNTRVFDFPKIDTSLDSKRHDFANLPTSRFPLSYLAAIFRLSDAMKRNQITIPVLVLSTIYKTAKCCR
jgi:hypothetical protein